MPPSSSWPRDAQAFSYSGGGFFRVAFALATALIVFAFGAVVLFVGVLLLLWMRIGRALGWRPAPSPAAAPESHAGGAPTGEGHVEPRELERFRGRLDEYLRLHRSRDER